MVIIIRNYDGSNTNEIHVPDDLWQGFAKGEFQEITWPIDDGPMPRSVLMRHDFK